MTDVMLDFETLGNGKDAAICQVGACYFSRHSGLVGSMFKRNVDARTSVESGAELDADTVYWWLSQSKEAIESITQPPGSLINIRMAMGELNDFLEGAEQIWSHATFDFVILQQTLKRLNIKPKFSYRAARDIRTIVDAAGINTKLFTREGVHHDALDDCVHQVQYVAAALNSLKKLD